MAMAEKDKRMGILLQEQAELTHILGTLQMGTHKTEEVRYYLDKLHKVTEKIIKGI